jgi:hypothetical protein
MSDNTGQGLFLCAIFRCDEIEIFFKTSDIFTTHIFLVMSSGTLLGYAWCLGDDGHVELSYATGVDCCGDGQESGDSEKCTTSSLSQPGADNCGLCLDSSAQQSEAVFSKRVKRTSTPSIEMPTPNNTHLQAVLCSPKTANALIAHTIPRIAQTILAHRIVVLLN